MSRLEPEVAHRTSPKTASATATVAALQALQNQVYDQLIRSYERLAEARAEDRIRNRLFLEPLVYACHGLVHQHTDPREEPLWLKDPTDLVVLTPLDLDPASPQHRLVERLQEHIYYEELKRIKSASIRLAYIREARRQERRQPLSITRLPRRF
jgi:hypothetical protein